MGMALLYQTDLVLPKYTTHGEYKGCCSLTVNISLGFPFVF